MTPPIRTRLVRIPFTYRIVGREARKRNAARFPVDDLLDLRIPEYDSDDLPAFLPGRDRPDSFRGAVVIGRRAFFDMAAVSRAAGGRADFEVAEDGSLSEDGAQARCLIDPTGICSAIPDGAWRRQVAPDPTVTSRELTWYFGDRFERRRPADSLRFSEIESSDRDEAAARAAAGAQEFAVVDGHLYTSFYECVVRPDGPSGSRLELADRRLWAASSGRTGPSTLLTPATAVRTGLRTMPSAFAALDWRWPEEAALTAQALWILAGPDRSFPAPLPGSARADALSVVLDALRTGVVSPGGSALVVRAIRELPTWSAQSGIWSSMAEALERFAGAMSDDRQPVSGLS